MKKVIMLGIALIMVCIIGGIAHAECAIMDDSLNLTIPCLEYIGERYEVALEYYVDPSDPAGIYLKLLSVADSTRNAECARIDDNLNLIIPSIYYSCFMMIFRNKCSYYNTIINIVFIDSIFNLNSC